MKIRQKKVDKKVREKKVKQKKVSEGKKMSDKWSTESYFFLLAYTILHTFIFIFASFI